MRTKKFKLTAFASLAVAIIILGMFSYQCSGTKQAAHEKKAEVLNTNPHGSGQLITLTFSRGSAHNHPLMAIWTEDTTGSYIETLFVAQSIGKGIFQHGEKSGGKWMPGPLRRPAALPYWGHQRGVKAPDGYFIPTPDDPLPDAITGPTPQGSFVLNARTSLPYAGKFFVLMEINQSWDWNEFWTNNKYPGDEQYKTSSQPAVVYRAEIDLDDDRIQYQMKPIGHSHYSGADGRLFEDLGTLTTALDITGKATVSVTKN